MNQEVNIQVTFIEYLPIKITIWRNIGLFEYAFDYPKRTQRVVYPIPTF